MLKSFVCCFCLLGFVVACQTEKPESVDLLILNARIIDVSNGEVSEDQLIAIRQDTIRFVGEMADTSSYTASALLDANHRLAMPGLWDMHVHFRGGDTLIQENKNLLPLFLAHGVTTVRDAGGDITPAVLEWRKAIQKGQLDGPDIFTSGPKLDGPDPAWPGSLPITTAEDIPPALDSLEQLGADYVKTYDGSLTTEMYYEIVRQTEERGLKITGHMPFDASILEAADLGLDGTEHLYYAMTAASPVQDSLRALNKGFGSLPDYIETYDPQLAEEAFRKLGSREFYATPTLHVGHTIANLHQADHSGAPLLAFMGPSIQKTYERRVRGAQNASPEQQQRRAQMEGIFISMVAPMQKAGITILAGSDCGPYNSYVYPGASLQEELILLVEAGLTPREALEASVINGPRFFELSDAYGSLAPGKVANLILLDRNPLEDIENIRSVSTVVKGAKVYDEDKIRDMMDATKY